MPRHPSTIAQLHGPDFVGATPPDMAAQEARVRHTLDDADQQIRALAHRIGYQLPGDCTDPDLIQRDVSANMRRSVDVCLELGRGLLVLKAASPHGTFLARLAVLGIEHRVAQRFMNAALRMANTSAPWVIEKAINSRTKLLELLVLDDEELDELALTGETGAITLDRIACMSTRELRAALREERADKEALSKLHADAAHARDELALENHKLQSPLADGQAARQIADKKARQAALLAATQATHDALCQLNQALADALVDNYDHPMVELANNAAAEAHWLLDQIYIDRNMELPPGYIPIRRLAHVVYSAVENAPFVDGDDDDARRI